MAYKQLDFRQRCQIYGLWQAGYNQTEIAKEVGVHKSTISRELKRNITFVRLRWVPGSINLICSRICRPIKVLFKNKAVALIV